jgi:glycosyltransferase involved in cell wall biosynthesis
MQTSLSIIIPAYNEARHIKACLDAIAAQSEAPDEVIVVDNNCSDDTAAIAQRYPFVRVVREPKQGRVFARDRGFNTASADVIGRIDADTILPQNWVAYVKAFYEDPAHGQVAWTGGGYFYNLPYSRVAGWVQGQIAYRMNRLLLGHYILWGSNMAIPRKVWSRVNQSVCHRNGIHEDMDLAIHLHNYGYTITYNEGIKVGVEARRAMNDRKALWDNLLWWPRTLQAHGNRRWVFGWIGAALIYHGGKTLPFFKFAERCTRALTLRRRSAKGYISVQYEYVEE